MSETPGVPSQPGSAQLERLQQLDRRIAQTVGQLIGSLQEEVDRRLSEATGELQRLFEKMKPATPDLSGAFLQPEDLSELMPPAPPPVSVEVPVPVRVSLNESLAPLLAGLARIDGESGQAPILKALLEESQRFATRAGFLLIRGGEIRGWAAQDLPEATLQATNFASLGGPFTRLLSADGTVVLSAGDCAQVAEALGVEAAAAGVLVPFQIRGQLAGALYADRLGNEEELAVSALQVLAYGAAQALETSQLRKGSSFALRLGAGEQLPEPPAATAPAAPFFAAPEPSYETPAPAEEPAYEAPAYEAPAYEAPAYEAPAAAAEPEPEYELQTSYVSGYVEELPHADGYDPLATAAEPAAAGYEATAYETPAGYESPAYESPAYEAPAPDASYSYAPAEPEPSYAAASYEAPGYEAPTYPAPSHETFEAPAYEAPAYEAPAYETPSYETPSYEPPAMETASFADPAYEAPAYEAPAYEAPAYEAPAYEPPAMETPSYAISYEPPAYEAPSYEAPSYEAPSYEAPSVAAPSYDISYPSSFDAPAAPAYEPPAYEAPAYEPPAYEAPAYEPASFEVPAIEPASFELVPEEEPAAAFDAPPAYEVSYESASYEVTYEPASEPSSFDTTFEPAAADGYAATEDVRFGREPPYELPSEEEIARENQPEPALEDTNIWEAEEDDEPTQIGQSTAAVPQQLEGAPTAPPAAAPVPPVAPAGLGQPGLGQQTVRLDISQLQSHATQLAQERYGDDTADVAPPAATAWSPPPAAPAYAPTYSPPSFATPEPAYGGAAYDQSEAPTMLGRGPMPAAAPAPAPPSSAGFAGPAATEQAPGGFGAGGFGAGEAKEPGGSTEVRPPADLVGPGRAFAAQAAGPRPVAGGGVEESLREEARRLARLLVSEIKLYNEEIIEEGRRSGNIYDRLKDDIDRSRQMYEERIDPRLTDQEDYFYQELVQRLAGGDVKLLGL